MRIRINIVVGGCLAAVGLIITTWVAAAEPDESGIGGTGHQPAPSAPHIIPGADLPTGVELPPAVQMPVIVAPPVLLEPVVPATDMTGVPNPGTVVAPTPQP